MKKLSTVWMVALITLSFSAHAELPSVQRQMQGTYNNQYNGYHNGYNQFNSSMNYGSGAYGGYGSAGLTPAQQQQTLYNQQMQSAQKVQKAYNTYMTGKDLLWLFTGDEGSFGKRLFYVFSGAIDRRFVQPVERSIGNLEQNRQMGVRPVAAQQPAYNQATQYCYDCIQQNQPNPYAQNPNALNPNLFQGNNQGTINQGGSSQTGGIAR